MVGTVDTLHVTFSFYSVLQRYDSSEMPAVVITPEELLHLVNSVMTATARAVSACNSQNQDELVTAAALGKKMVDLLRGCKVSEHV